MGRPRYVRADFTRLASLDGAPDRLGVDDAIGVCDERSVVGDGSASGATDRGASILGSRRATSESAMRSAGTFTASLAITQSNPTRARRTWSL